MATRRDAKWMRPQAVPRGFLRLYVLSLLSKRDEMGYSIIQQIEDKTEGAWRPSPGTIYPLMRELKKEGLAKAVPSSEGKEGTVTYAITEKGAKTLGDMQHTLISAGKKERVMFRLFADLLPPTAMAPLFLRSQRDSFELFEGIIEKIPPEERSSILSELEVILETRLAWVHSVQAKTHPKREKPLQVRR